MAESNATTVSQNMTVDPADSAILGACYLVTSLLVMFSNGIVVVVVVTSRELHLPTLWNIAFMAVCDFSYGLHYLVFAVPSAFVNQFAYPAEFIGVVSSTLTLLFGQNILNVTVATIDRYISVCWPLRYSQLMTSKRFLLAITISGVINVCRLCLIIGPEPEFYYNSRIAVCMTNFKTILSGVASVGFPIIAVILITGVLIRISVEIVNSRRRNGPASAPRTTHFTVTISLAAGLFCFYLPSCISIIWHVKAGSENVPTVIGKFAIICLLSNSLWNVVIYAVTYRPFRQAFLRLFCKDYHKRRRQMEVHAIFRERRIEGSENG